LEDDPKLQARIKARVTWPCRVQSESDLESIAGEVITAGQGAAHGGSNRSDANLRFQGAPERI
jgi:hypothetical protein